MYQTVLLMQSVVMLPSNQTFSNIARLHGVQVEETWRRLIY